MGDWTSSNYITGEQGWLINGAGGTEFATVYLRHLMHVGKPTGNAYTAIYDSATYYTCDVDGDGDFDWISTIQVDVPSGQFLISMQYPQDMWVGTWATTSDLVLASGNDIYIEMPNTGTIVPNDHNQYYFGASNFRWKDGYFTDCHIANGVTVGDIHFKNDWSITEEGDDLVFVNPKGQKVLKLKEDGKLNKLSGKRKYKAEKPPVFNKKKKRKIKPTSKPKQ